MHYNQNSYDENISDRHFFNPVTGQPIKDYENVDLQKEFENMICPDDDIIKYNILYDACDDLNEKEYAFFVLWNKFMDSYESKVKIMNSLEEYLIEFIGQNLDYIKKKELVNELLLFMNFLLDKGDISLTFFLIWSAKINYC